MEKYRVKIIQIEALDKEGLEAEVLFEINGEQLWAFCHPCYFVKGQTVEVHFSSLEDIDESVFWNENQERKKDIIPSGTDKCRYYCYGVLNQINPVKIDCGAITFTLGDYTNDLSIIGTYVYFVISRLDISGI